MRWVDEKLSALSEKGSDKWTQEDVEAYAYCMQTKFEHGEFEED